MCTQRTVAIHIDKMLLHLSDIVSHWWAQVPVINLQIGSDETNGVRLVCYHNIRLLKYGRFKLNKVVLFRRVGLLNCLGRYHGLVENGYGKCSLRG